MSIEGIAKRVLLVICDGMGFSDNTNLNAVKTANTPNLDSMVSNFPTTTIIPGGESVGLPKGVAGNSEVGHMNLGAGRPVRQDLVRINEAIEMNIFKDMPKLKELISVAKENSKKVHLMVLLSDGGVHSHINHLKAAIDILRDKGVEVYLHAFMDGRDTPKTNGIKYVKDIQSYGGFTFASMQGRSIGMDRDRRWEKIKRAYDTMIGEGEITNQTPEEFILGQYEKEIYDEFITPVLFTKEGAVRSEDAMFFLNFRPDRARQITLSFCDPKFEHFQNKVRPKYFLCMSPYVDEELPQVPILFNREKIKKTLSEHISHLGLKQLKIAETEKYAHVTYFLNGGEETPFPGEDRILVDSPKEVATYDEKPEMSAPEVLDKLLAKLDDESYSLYVVNFANPDMVGHTGNFNAAVKAMEYIDYCLGKLRDKCLLNNIAMIVTADHGNCDQMAYEDGSMQTSHSDSDVPFILVAPGLQNKKLDARNKGTNSLKDVAPTILHILGVKAPDEFVGKTIFE